MAELSYLRSHAAEQHALAHQNRRTLRGSQHLQNLADVLIGDGAVRNQPLRGGIKFHQLALFHLRTLNVQGHTVPFRPWVAR